MGRQAKNTKQKQKNRIAGRMKNGGDGRPVFPQGGRLASPALRQLVDCVHGAKLPVFILGARLCFAENPLAVFFGPHFLRWARRLGRFQVVKKNLRPPGSLSLQVSLP
jgi:hypothetical protein